jgi:hypothetical protein
VRLHLFRLSNAMNFLLQLPTLYQLSLPILPCRLSQQCRRKIDLDLFLVFKAGLSTLCRTLLMSSSRALDSSLRVFEVWKASSSILVSSTPRTSPLKQQNSTHHCFSPLGRMKSLLMSLRSAYHSRNGYHNFSHATDVTQACYTFLVRMGLAPPLHLLCEDDYDPNTGEARRKWRRNREVEQGRMGKLMRPMDVFALIVSCIGHDVGHPGLSNAYLVRLLFLLLFSVKLLTDTRTPAIRSTLVLQSLKFTPTSRFSKTFTMLPLFTCFASITSITY